jgi:hypothetical protein
MGSTMLAMTLTVGSLKKGIEADRGGLGNGEHVGGVDGLPAADGGAVEADALFKGSFIPGFEGVGTVLPGAEHVDELEVDHFGVVLLRKLKEFTRCRHLSLLLIRK